MKHILLLTDFSESANNAVSYATALWADVDCTFHLLHLVRSSAYTTESLIAGDANSDVYKSLLSSSKAQLNALYESLSKANTNTRHRFKAHLDHDSFIAAINQLIEKESAELVVLGSNGASNMSELVFGSHALKVMRQLEHNVLIVPDTFGFHPVKRLLLLIDSNDEFNQSQAQGIKALSQTLNSEIHVLCLDLDKNSIDGFIKNNFPSNTKLTNIKDIPAEYATSTYIQANDIDMLVMVGHMEGFIDRLKGNTGKTKISKLYQLPILLVRE